MSEKTGDTLWQPDSGGGVQPQRVGGGARGGGMGDAPADGTAYARRDRLWVPVPVGDDAPADGLQYARQDGGWTLVAVGEAPVDATPYARQDAGWVATLADAPQDGQEYVRNNGQWVEGVGEAPSDGEGYVRKDGGWVVPDTAGFKVQWGVKSWSAPADPASSTSVDFSEGRNPDVSSLYLAAVTATFQDFQGRVIAFVDQITSAGFRLSVRRQDNVNLSGTLRVHWVAVGT